MQKLPRLSLIFSTTSRGLRTIPSIVSLIATIIVGDLAQFFADSNKRVGNIDISDWSRNRVSLNLITIIFLLFLLPSFFVRDFSAFKMVKRDCFLSLDLRVFNLGVFYKTTLALSSSKIGWSYISRTILVSFTSSRAKSECCFSLNLNYFLYHVFEIVQFVAALLYFSPDRRFYTFLKVFNFCRFF